MKNWSDLVSVQIPLQRRILPAPKDMRDGDLLGGGFTGDNLLGGEVSLGYPRLTFARASSEAVRYLPECPVVGEPGCPTVGPEQAPLGRGGVRREHHGPSHVLLGAITGQTVDCPSRVNRARF